MSAIQTSWQTDEVMARGDTPSQLSTDKAAIERQCLQQYQQQ